MSQDIAHHDRLRKEATLYTQYLINRHPSEEIIERYAHANRKLAIDSDIGPDASIVRFSLAHPWSIPFLDAAAGLLRPEALLRKKIYTMSAVLEASTKYTEHFLPSLQSSPAFIMQLVYSGLLALIKVLIGIPLWLIVRDSE
jgi:hypothetical protein